MRSLKMDMKMKLMCTAPHTVSLGWNPCSGLTQATPIRTEYFTDWHILIGIYKNKKTKIIQTFI